MDKTLKTQLSRCLSASSAAPKHGQIDENAVMSVRVSDENRHHFLIILLLFVQLISIGHFPDSSSLCSASFDEQMNEKSPAYSDSIIIPAEQSVIAFMHDPIVIPARWRTDIDPTKHSPDDIPTITQAVLPNGTSIEIEIRWLVVRRDPWKRSPDTGHLIDPTNTVSKQFHGLFNEQQKQSHRQPIWTESSLNGPEFIEVPKGLVPLPFFKRDFTRQPFYLIEWSNELTDGVLLIGGEPVNLRIHDQPTGDLGITGDWIGGDSQGLTLPDPWTPLESFRRTLLADRITDPADRQPPTSRLLQAIGRHNTAQWLLGLDTLKKFHGIDPNQSLGDEITENLTRIIQDGSTHFAAWTAHPHDMITLEKNIRELSNLKSTTSPQSKGWIHETREHSKHTAPIRVLLESQPDFISWIESDHGSSVRLAAANLTSKPIIFGIRWFQTSTGRAIDESPLPMPINPASVSRITLPRPEGISNEPLELRLSTRQSSRQLPVGPNWIPVHPPGVTIDRFVETWRLDSWQNSHPIPALTQNETSVTIQRGNMGWEIFIEANLSQQGRPISVPQTNSNIQDNTTPQPPPGDWTNLIGYEAVTILLGPVGNPSSAITISPDPTIKTIIDWLGSDIGPTDVDLKVTDTHWLALIRLPSNITYSNTLDIGIIRTHRQSSQVHVVPYPCLPWQLDPGRIRLNLNTWQPIPQQ